MYSVPTSSFSRRPGGACSVRRVCGRVWSTIGEGFWRRDPEIACAILENLLYIAGKTLRIASDGLAVIQTVQTGINGSDPNRAHMIAGNRGDGVFGNSEIPPVQLECAIVVKV